MDPAIILFGLGVGVLVGTDVAHAAVLLWVAALLRRRAVLGIGTT